MYPLPDRGHARAKSEHNVFTESLADGRGDRPNPVSIIADAADGADGIFETPAYPDDPVAGVVCTVAATKEPNFA
jgi:hypothetical protein